MVLFFGVYGLFIGMFVIWVFMLVNVMWLFGGRYCESKLVSVNWLMGFLIMLLNFLWINDFFKFLWFVVVMVIIGIFCLCCLIVCRVFMLFIIGIWIFIKMRLKGWLCLFVCKIVFRVFMLFLV